MELEPTGPWRPAISVHLRIRVVSGRQSDLHRFLADAIPFYESPGGIRVRLLSDSSDPERFTELIECIDEQTYREEMSASTLTARWRSTLRDGVSCSPSRPLSRCTEKTATVEVP